MSTPERAAGKSKLAGVLKKLASLVPAQPIEASGVETPAPGLHEDEVLRELVLAMLCWDAPASKAHAALVRIDAACVDLNDLRVCLVEEMVRIIGPGYPRATDRCTRLRLALNDITRRYQRLELSHLLERPKREARSTLESIAGVPAYVSARVALTRLGCHALPVDDRILTVLVAGGVMPPGATPESAQSQIERLIPAGEAAEAYRLLQAAADLSLELKPARSVARKRPAARASAHRPGDKHPPRPARAKPAPGRAQRSR